MVYLNNTNTDRHVILSLTFFFFLFFFRMLVVEVVVIQKLNKEVNLYTLLDKIYMRDSFGRLKSFIQINFLYLRREEEGDCKLKKKKKKDTTFSSSDV